MPFTVSKSKHKFNVLNQLNTQKCRGFFYCEYDLTMAILFELTVRNFYYRQ